MTQQKEQVKKELSDLSARLVVLETQTDIDRQDVEDLKQDVEAFAKKVNDFYGVKDSEETPQ